MKVDQIGPEYLIFVSLLWTIAIFETKIWSHAIPFYLLSTYDYNSNDYNSVLSEEHAILNLLYTWNSIRLES